MSGKGMWDIEWIDRGREPQSPPDARYPHGIDLQYVTDIGVPTCKRPLPYPAKRIGFYVVHCRTCDQRIVVTTAGRPDDPRSLQLTCGRPAPAPEQEIQP